MEGIGPKDRQFKVFISYSRNDFAFADRLEAVLNADGIETLIDRSEIYAFEDWWKRIQDLISQADTVVFILSPESVASPVCQKEVAFAAALNKRFAPIVVRRVDVKTVPVELSQLNFIFFDDATKFGDSMDRLVEALTTNIDWVRRHTQFGVNSRSWIEARRPNGLLLRSPLLELAEQWIASRPERAPEPTPETREFIIASRGAATRFRNIVTGSLAAGLVLALGLAGLAYLQRKEAVQQGAIAIEQRDQALLTQSKYLTSVSRIASDESNDHETAALLALEALPDEKSRDAVKRMRPYWLPAEVALERSLRSTVAGSVVAGRHHTIKDVAATPGGDRIIWAGGSSVRVQNAETGEEQLRLTHNLVTCIAVFSSGKRILSGGLDKVARVWDASTGQEVLKLEGHAGSIYAVAVSDDEARILTGSSDGSVRVWDASSGEQIARLESGSGIRSIAIAKDGSRIYANLDKASVIWDGRTFEEIDRADDAKRSFGRIALSGNGERIATTPIGELQVWDAGLSRLIWRRHLGSGWVNSVAISWDGTSVVAGMSDGMLRVFGRTDGWRWYPSPAIPVSFPA
jgi:hypothetical protein